ncbi:hypothetical protein DFH07DRAFT_953650 [Mycena maculata]|uniref:Uncharacterized protein n=1 Tax=Mycena maculata TaxID=230809 RepID=A0AAD7JSZ7_9AGAR|nr:hypothetical protein DFH07DRAFT_953650 [Mycena maculata]
MIFPSSLLVLSLGLFAGASPVPSRHDTVPNTSVVPLTAYSVFQTLEEAVTALKPGLETIATSDSGGQTGNVAPLLSELTDALNTATASLAHSPGDAGAATTRAHDIHQDLNTALNGLVTELGLDNLLTPVDMALSGLLTGLNAILPGVLAIVGGV